MGRGGRRGGDKGRGGRGSKGCGRGEGLGQAAGTEQPGKEKQRDEIAGRHVVIVPQEGQY